MLFASIIGGFIIVFFRDNALAYPVAIFTVVLARPIAQFLLQPAKSYRWNGILLLGLTLATLSWVLFLQKPAAVVAPDTALQIPGEQDGG